MGGITSQGHPPPPEPPKAFAGDKMTIIAKERQLLQGAYGSEAASLCMLALSDTEIPFD